MCEQCLASRTPPLCTDCRGKYHDPLGVLSQPFSVEGSLRHGWTLFARTLPRLLPIALVIGGISGVLTHFLEASAGADLANKVDRIFEGTIGLIADGAFLALMVGEAEAFPRDVGAAFKEGLNAWPRLFGARFRSGLWILLFTLLLVVPGILKALSLAVVTEAAFREPGTDALESSTQLTRGRRLPIFGLFVVCALAIFLAVLPLGFVGGILLALVPASGIVVNVFLGMCYQLAGAFASGVSLAAFYGLKCAHGQALEPLPESSGEAHALHPAP